MKWNAELYGIFAKERLQPALDLLNRVPDGEYHRIIDIGCGSGMSTLPLLHRFENAEISGVDLSEEMLQQAKTLTQKVKWIKRDCSRPFSDMGRFDLVFSNAFLQWLPDQEGFIKNVADILDTNGIFALQVPDYDDMPVKKCADAAAGFYGSRFDGTEKTICHNRSLYEYYDMLCGHFGDIEIWQTKYSHIMDDHDAIVRFVSATGIRPYLEILNKDEQEDFKNRLAGELEKVYPVRKNGRIIFPFERIEFIARK